jgi:hypothetical protein
MISAYPAEGKIIKNNILAAEAAQTENETNISFRIIRMGINKIQVPNNFSDKE